VGFDEQPRTAVLWPVVVSAVVWQQARNPFRQFSEVASKGKKVRSEEMKDALTHSRCLSLICGVAIVLTAQLAFAQSKTKSQAPGPMIPFTPAPSADDLKVISALRTPVRVTLNSVPLEEAVTRLGQAANVAAELERSSLAEMRISPQLTVTITGNGQSLEATLWAWLPKHQLDYVVQNGKLMIMGARRASTRLMTRTYDLSGVLRPGIDRKDVIRSIIEAGPRSDWYDVGHVMGTAALEPADPLADCQRWRNRHGQMDVRLGSPDLVYECLGRVDDAFLQQAVGHRFKRRREQGRTVFCVPDDVQVDFGVVVFGHGLGLRGGWSWLKPTLREGP